MPDHPTRFASALELARLPWFEVAGGRLRLAAPGVGPVIDVHTHLALSYVRPPRVDLWREWPETEHYLPLSAPLDLEGYVNKNFSQERLGVMRRDLTLGSLGAGGLRRTHTLANLRREMGELGVVAACLLPIDAPALSRNAVTWLRAARGHEAFVGFGSVHPWHRDVPGELDRQVALGARGIKVHPAVQSVLPQARRAITLYRECARRSLPVLWHCGPVDIETRLGRWLSQVRHYERPIAECPETTFVLGHSGALQMEQALGFARSYPNVYLDVSSQSLAGVRRMLDEVDPGRILFGSDWPFYHQAIPLAKVLIATEGREDLRAALLYGNAARLMGLCVRDPRAEDRKTR